MMNLSPAKRFVSSCLVAAGCLAASAASTLTAASPGDGLQILPPQPALTGPHASQQLIVDEVRDGDFVGDLTSQARFTSQHPNIAAVDAQGLVTPVNDGTATIRAEIGGRTVETHVVVRSAKAIEPWSFRHDVQTVLTKTGCNMGACHGAQAGKKGFKLALRGYDHEADYNTLTRQSRGRRVNPSEPAQSLILLKATGAIPHGGGTRFDINSLDYRIVSEWIAEGALPPSAADPVVTKLEVFPKQVRLDRKGAQRLLVQAVYSDGRKRDVTRWTKFNSTEIGVAQIDDLGAVTVVGNGEATITVWFASKVAVATISVPYDNQIPPEIFANSPKPNFIDGLIVDKLQRLRLPPSGPATDGEFMRRAYLDTLGVLPSVTEARAFLADSSTDKRSRLIEELLARPEYVDYWSYKWSDLLLVTTGARRLKPAAMWSFYEWIRQSVASNMPWDRFATEIVTARGSTLDNGAANYFVLHKDPKQLNETTTVTFLGTSIACAQCHDHPLERWTQDEYFSMANLFARVRQKEGNSEGEVIVFPVTEGNIKHPNRIMVPIPRPLDGTAIAIDDPADRRVHLARWMTSPDNPYFARAIVNRVWANYMGRGLVEMVDDLRATNPASNELLLSALAADFVKHKYDVKHLIRTIMQSAAYQRTAATVKGNEQDDRFYSRYLVKRMSAEVMLDALSQVTGITSDFPDYPKGMRAMQLPDNNVTSYFLSAFGRPAREFTCECERTEEPSITQTLHLANGKTFNDKLKAAGGVIDNALTKKLSDAEVLDQLYLAAFTRLPTDAEKTSLLAALEDVSKTPAADEKAALAIRRAAFEDLFWATLTSKEFMFVH